MKNLSRRNTVSARRLRKEATPSEALLWTALRNRQLGVKFRRQYPIPDTPYVVDFCCLEQHLIIEIDGGIHDTQKDKDASRQQEIEALNYRFIRFSTSSIREDMPAVLQVIQQFLK